jgi:glycosyltransferase involved in cell wall biosynthesis
MEAVTALRIALDGRAFGTPAGGVRRYTNELFAAMHSIAPEVALVAIGGAAVSPGVSRQPAPSILPTNLGWCLTGLPLAARRTHFDLFHAPAYTGPLWGVHPLVLTIHDVSYARCPQWSPHPHGVGRIRQAFYRACAQRADRILTDSVFSKSEIIAAYGIDERRIDVVPLGVAAAFRPDRSATREAIVLHVGDLHPRRNLPMLLDAVIDLARNEPRLSSLRLVLAGRDLGPLDELRARASAAGMSDRLHYLGRPSDADLAGWYQRAGVMAYPSRYEGFGLPVLEALACGTPVVASNAASIPEVTGQAAVLLPPEDLHLWARTIRDILLDPARAHEMGARGIDQARAFSWQRTAEMTLSTYRTSVAGRVSALARTRSQ